MAPGPGQTWGATVLGAAPGLQTHWPTWLRASPLPRLGPEVCPHCRGWAPALTPPACAHAAGFPYPGRAGRHRRGEAAHQHCPLHLLHLGLSLFLFLKTFFPSLNWHFKPHSKPCIKAGACTRPGWLAAVGLRDHHPPLTRTNGARSHSTPCLSSFLSLSLSLSLIYSTSFSLMSIPAWVMVYTAEALGPTAGASSSCCMGQQGAGG